MSHQPDPAGGCGIMMIIALVVLGVLIVLALVWWLL
jgi:hypothetical protein